MERRNDLHGKRDALTQLRKLARRVGFLCWLLALPIAATSHGSEEKEAGASVEIARADPAARLPEGDGASEYWDLTVRLESGHWVLARFIITDIGPGDRNALVSGFVIQPDGSKVRFKNGRRQGRWTLAADRRALDVGTSHLTLRDPLYRLFIDKDAVRVDLRFPAQAVPQPPKKQLPDAYELELLALAAPVEGSIELPSMGAPLAVSGHAALVHTVVGRDEAKAIARRIDFYNLAESAVYAVGWTEPDGRTGQWLAAKTGPEGARSTDRFEFRLEGRLEGVQRDGYDVPSGVDWTGECAQGHIKLLRPLLEDDPLSILPSPLRWFARLRMNPHRVWADGPFDVTLRPCSNRPPVAIQGTGITALTFLNRLDGRDD